jgi:hypothetical protein
MVKRMFKDLRRQQRVAKLHGRPDFGLHISPTKDKVTLPFAGCYMERSSAAQGVWFPQWATLTVPDGFKG